MIPRKKDLRRDTDKDIIENHLKDRNYYWNVNINWITKRRIKKLLLAPMRDSYKKLKIMLSAVYFSYKRSSIITGYAEKHFRNLPFC